MAINTPTSPEAEDDDIDQSANDAGKGVYKDVANCTVTTNDGELVNFVDGAIGDAEDDWVKSKGDVGEFCRMETFNEGGDRET